MSASARAGGALPVRHRRAQLQRGPAASALRTRLRPARYSRRAVKALTKGISDRARISGRTPRSTRLCRAEGAWRGKVAGGSAAGPSTMPTIWRAGRPSRSRPTPTRTSASLHCTATQEPEGPHLEPGHQGLDQPPTRAALSHEAPPPSTQAPTWNLTTSASRSYQPRRSQKAAVMDALRAARSCRSCTSPRRTCRGGWVGQGGWKTAAL